MFPFLKNDKNKLIGVTSGPKIVALPQKINNLMISDWEYPADIDYNQNVLYKKDLFLHIYIDSNISNNGSGSEDSPFNTFDFVLDDCVSECIELHCLGVLIHVKGVWDLKPEHFDSENYRLNYSWLSILRYRYDRLWITNWQDSAEDDFWHVKTFSRHKFFEKSLDQSYITNFKYMSYDIIYPDGIDGTTGADGADGAFPSDNGADGAPGGDASYPEYITVNGCQIEKSPDENKYPFVFASYNVKLWKSKFHLYSGRCGYGGMGGNGGHGADGGYYNGEKLYNGGRGGSAGNCGKSTKPALYENRNLYLNESYFGFRDLFFIDCQIDIDVKGSFTSVDYSSGGGIGGNGGSGIFDYTSSGGLNYGGYSGSGGSGYIQGGTPGLARFSNAGTPTYGRIRDIQPGYFVLPSLKYVIQSKMNLNLLFDDFVLNVEYPDLNDGMVGANGVYAPNKSYGEDCGKFNPFITIQDLSQRDSYLYNTELNINYKGLCDIKYSVGNAGNGGDDVVYYPGGGGSVDVNLGVSFSGMFLSIHHCMVNIDFTGFGIKIQSSVGNAGNAGKYLPNPEQWISPGGSVIVDTDVNIYYITIIGEDSTINVIDENFYNIWKKIPSEAGKNSIGVAATYKNNESIRFGVKFENVIDITTNATIYE